MGVTWRIRGRTITITRPFVLGILNVTPDSFSNGGLFATREAAVAHAERMVEEGADGIDIGGESTRPSAQEVSAAEEIRRVVPVVAGVRARYVDLPISVDTSKSEVAWAALDSGADIINDVSAFRLDRRMGDIVAEHLAGVILMHSRGGVAEMGTYRFADYGDDVVGEIMRELSVAITSARSNGIASDAIVVDPGIGFAKRSEDSLRVLAGLPRIAGLGFPLMVGVSRKRFVGHLSGVDKPADRVAGTVGANVVALLRGAQLFRVHDVAPNRQALDVAWAIVDAGRPPVELSASPDSHPRAGRGHPPIPDSR